MPLVCACIDCVQVAESEWERGGNKEETREGRWWKSLRWKKQKKAKLRRAPP